MNKPISLYKWLLVINADLMNNLKLIYLNILTDQAHTFSVKESAHLKHTRLDPDQICARMWKLFACDVYSACPQLFVWLKIAGVPMRLLPDFSHIWMLLPGQQSPPNGKDTERSWSTNNTIVCCCCCVHACHQSMFILHSTSTCILLQANKRCSASLHLCNHLWNGPSCV